MPFAKVNPLASNPKIFMYPSGLSTLVKVSLPRITRCEPVDQVDREDGYTGNLGMVSTFRGIRRRVRITIERQSMLTAAGLAYYASLQAVISHLQTGGAIGFTQDDDYTWAGYASGTWAIGSSSVMYAGNAFSAWNGAAAPANGQQVVIESDGIFGQSEQHLCTSLVGTSQISISPTLTLDYTSTKPAMVRWWRFWPALRLPADKLSPPLSNEHGINWSMDLTLEVDNRIFHAAGDAYAQPKARFPLGNTQTGTSFLSLDGILAASKEVKQGLGALRYRNRKV